MFAFGCSSDSEPALTGAATGVTVRAADGEIAIPSGALAAGVTVEGAALSSPPHAPPRGYTIAGSVYRFTPHGTVFQKPATVRIPVAVPGGTVFSLSDERDTTWERVPAVSRDGNAFTFQTSHISFFAELVGGDPDAGAGPVVDASVHPIPDGAIRRDTGSEASIHPATTCGGPKVEFLAEFAAVSTNEDGTIIGGVNMAPSGAWVAAVWTTTTGMTAISNPACTGVTGLGPTDREAYVSCDPPLGDQLWNIDDGSLSPIPIKVNAVSDDGLVVAGFDSVGPAVWSRAAGIVRISDSGNFAATNRDGTVIVGGTSSTAAKWNKTPQGYVMTAITGQPFPGAAEGMAVQRVSSDGRVVVGWGNEVDSQWVATYWSDGKMVALGRGAAWAVNADGSSIGGFLATDTSPLASDPGYAFLWDPVHGSRLLVELIDPAPFGSLRPYNVEVISHDGCVVIGRASDATRNEGFRVVLPSPPADLETGTWDAGPHPDL